MGVFLEQLKAGADRCGLRGSRVLVAVSGGADSVALLRGLCELQPALRLELIAAHLNHQLRGEQSDRDAAWVQALCDKVGVRLVSGRRDVAGMAAEQGRGLEETARRLRYDFLSEIASREDCAFVATAHTADDQAETILHHIVRGTGLSGLSGMAAVRPLTDTVQLARPLLDVRRSEIEHYLRETGQDYRTDDSNRDPAFTRNRIRLELLPTLKQDFNPQIEQALLRLGRQAAEFQSMLDELAERLLDAALLDRNETTCRLDCAQLAGQPPHLVRECFILLWKHQNWPRQRMRFDDWQRLAELVQCETAGTAFVLPGSITASRRGGLLGLQRSA